MYNKFASIFLLVALLGCSLPIIKASTSTVTLQVFGSSSIWWLAVLPQNDNLLTTMIELKDASSSSFSAMSANPGWGYYTYTSTSGRGFSFPMTLRLTSATGSQISVQISSIVPGAVVDTGAQYSGSTTAPTTKPTNSPSSTTVPTTKPTTTPTTVPTTHSTTAPTTKPTTAPTTAPTSHSTTAPTTKPTTAPTTAPNGDLCALVPTTTEPMKVLVPLYVYPGSAWDELIAAASQVQIIAIINPNSGPLPTVDSSYASYMTKFKNAGIEMVGYVHTTYGERAIADVQADIDTWASNYPLITGIFLDEASNDASELTYYTQVYNYVMSKPGYQHSILNPGMQPDQGYLSISTNIVMYENYASDVASTTYSSWVKCAPTAAQKSGYKYKFSAIVHTAASGSESSYISSVNNWGMGLVYVTDGVGGCCTYNTLTSYFPQEATSVQSLNA